MQVKKLFSWHNLLFLLLLSTVLQSKVLIVVDHDYYYHDGGRQVSRYLYDVNNIDHTLASLLVWNWDPRDTTKTIRDNCFLLWKALQQSYIANRHTPPTSEDITGAVFIGDLPIPKFYHGQLLIDTIINGDTLWKNIPNSEYPHDYYFMVLFNQNTGTFFSTASITLHNKINFESNSLTYKYI